MSQETVVYDLGVVDSQGPAPDTRQRVAARAAKRAPRRGLDTFADSVELFVPGAGQLCRSVIQSCAPSHCTSDGPRYSPYSGELGQTITGYCNA